MPSLSSDPSDALVVRQWQYYRRPTCRNLHCVLQDALGRSLAFALQSSTDGQRAAQVLFAIFANPLPCAQQVRSRLLRLCTSIFLPHSIAKTSNSLCKASSTEQANAIFCWKWSYVCGIFGVTSFVYSTPPLLAGSFKLKKLHLPSLTLWMRSQLRRGHHRSRDGPYVLLGLHLR